MGKRRGQWGKGVVVGVVVVCRHVHHVQNLNSNVPESGLRVMSGNMLFLSPPTENTAAARNTKHAIFTTHQTQPFVESSHRPRRADTATQKNTE